MRLCAAEAGPCMVQGTKREGREAGCPPVEFPLDRGVQFPHSFRHRPRPLSPPHTNNVLSFCRSRGKPVCQVSVSLRELLQAAGVVSPQGPAAALSPASRLGEGSSGEPAPASAPAAATEPGESAWCRLRSQSVAAVRGMVAAKAPYDPEFWPRGKIAIKASSGLMLSGRRCSRSPLGELPAKSDVGRFVWGIITLAATICKANWLTAAALHITLGPSLLPSFAGQTG